VDFNSAIRQPLENAGVDQSLVEDAQWHLDEIEVKHGEDPINFGLVVDRDTNPFYHTLVLETEESPRGRTALNCAIISSVKQEAVEACGVEAAE